MRRMSKAELKKSIRIWDEARALPPLAGSDASFENRVDNSLDELLGHLYPSQQSQDS